MVLIEKGAAIRVEPKGFVVPALITVQLNSEHLTFSGRLFGWKLFELLHATVSDIKKAELVRERGFSVMRFVMSSGRNYVFRPRIPQKWVEEVRRLGIPMVESTHSYAANRAMSRIVSIFGLLVIPFLLIALLLLVMTIANAIKSL